MELQIISGSQDSSSLRLLLLVLCKIMLENTQLLSIKWDLTINS